VKKILIIDDEEKIRTAYKAALIKEGFEVLEAKDAAQGISEMFRNEDAISLVLLDIKMPQMNGSRVKDIIEDYDLPFRVIISSVYSIDEQKHFVPNANDYFDEVQGVDVLIEKVKKVLGYGVGAGEDCLGK